DFPSDELDRLQFFALWLGIAATATCIAALGALARLAARTPAVAAGACWRRIGLGSGFLAAALVGPGGRNLGSFDDFLVARGNLAVLLGALGAGGLVQGTGNTAGFGLGSLQNLAGTTEHFTQGGSLGFGSLAGAFAVFVDDRLCNDALGGGPGSCRRLGSRLDAFGGIFGLHGCGLSAFLSWL